MRLIPVYLGGTYCSVSQTNRSDTFHFAPPAKAILPAESHNITNATACSNSFNLFNIPGNFEMHACFSSP